MCSSAPCASTPGLIPKYGVSKATIASMYGKKRVELLGGGAEEARFSRSGTPSFAGFGDDGLLVDCVTLTPEVAGTGSSLAMLINVSAATMPPME